MLSWSQLYKPLILCVDHDEATLDLIRLALEARGYRVLTANESSTALEAFAVCPIDTVILEYDMPDINGGEVARRMSQMKPSIPKLLFSQNPRLSCPATQDFQAYCAKRDGLLSLAERVGEVTALTEATEAVPTSAGLPP